MAQEGRVAARRAAGTARWARGRRRAVEAGRTGRRRSGRRGARRAAESRGGGKRGVRGDGSSGTTRTATTGRRGSTRQREQRATRLGCLRTHAGATRAAATPGGTARDPAPSPRTSPATPRHLTTGLRKRQETETERRRGRETERQATGEARTAMRSPCVSEPHAFRAHAAGPVKSEPEIRAP